MGISNWILGRTIKSTISSINNYTGGNNFDTEGALSWIQTRRKSDLIIMTLQVKKQIEGLKASQAVRATLWEELGLWQDRSQEKDAEISALIEKLLDEEWPGSAKEESDSVLGRHRGR